MIKANTVGVRFLRINKMKRQELKSLIFQFLKGKRPTVEEFWALKDVSFSVDEGEIVGIIGANGAGKSTLCRVLSNILVPDEGEISVEGLVSALLSLGTGFNAELSGHENIYLNGMMLGFSKKKIDELYDQIVDFSGIKPFIHTPIKQYSKGMQARLGFSIAAMLEPEILILDETLNPGDEEFRKAAMSKMQELMKKAKVVIIVSHDLNMIEERCTRAIWLQKGSIQRIGEPADLCTAYRQSVPKQKPKKKLLESYTKSNGQSHDTMMVSLEHVSVKFRVERKDFWALKDISLRVNQGEILGVIGHNGAGKSTLCKLLGNIIKPDIGTISIQGKTTEILGFGAGFNKELSGTENIYLNGLLLGIPLKDIKKKHTQIVAFADLGDAIERPLKEFSSGMKSRLGFSIATSVDPEILIIDEALSAGDLSFHQKAAEKIQSFMNQAKAVIIVTHNLNFVSNVCTRVVWIDQGSIVSDGKPEEVVAAYSGGK